QGVRATGGDRALRARVPGRSRVRDTVFANWRHPGAQMLTRRRDADGGRRADVEYACTRRCMMRRFELPVAGALRVGLPATTRMHRSTRWRDPVLWLGLSVAAAYLG